jgi:hypothetical protein
MSGGFWHRSGKRSYTKRRRSILSSADSTASDGALLAGDEEIEEIYVNVVPPRRQWRIVERTKHYVKLIRVDNPNVMRFPHESALRDKKRYRRA